MTLGTSKGRVAHRSAGLRKVLTDVLDRLMHDRHERRLLLNAWRWKVLPFRLYDAPRNMLGALSDDSTVIITRRREKFINAVVFFAQNTNHCGKVKLFKLLYLLDFAHFRETGRSVTMLDYYAWKLGPVPQDLAQEWYGLEPDLATAIDVVPERVYDYYRDLVVPKVAFDDSLFTKRELRIMDELATRFRDDLTQPLVKLTHEERGPWDKIWDGGRGRNERIPYQLAIPDTDPNRDAILESANEYAGLLHGSQRSN